MRSRRRTLLPLILAVVALPLVEARAADRQTLQEFLERLKRMRDGVRAEISGTAEQIWAAIAMEAQVRREKGCEEQRDKLIALGAEATPLLVDKLEPGANATDAQKLASLYLAQALAAIPTRAVTDALIAILKDG